MQDEIDPIADTGEHFDYLGSDNQYQCEITGDFVVIHSTDESNVMVYEIELRRLDTPEKLLGWVLHLSDKVWVTTGLLRNLIELVGARFGFRLHGFP